MRPSPRGFTLLELLVAIAIFAMLGIGSYRLLASTIATRDASREHDAALIRLQKVMVVLQRDLAQAAPRPVRNDYGDAVGAVVLRNNSLEFSREGWPNPLEAPRSEMQRVRYEVNEKGELWRLAWSQLDRERGMEPGKSLLLEKVDGLQIRVTGGNGQVESEWPAQRSQNSSNPEALAVMPVAVEWIMSVKPWGEIRRIFRLPDSTEPRNGEQNP